MNKPIGDTVNTLLNSCGFSQRTFVKELAKRGVVNWSQGTLSRIVNGERDLRVSEAQALAEMFFVTVDQIVSGEAADDPNVAVSADVYGAVMAAGELIEAAGKYLYYFPKYQRAMKNKAIPADVRNNISDIPDVTVAATEIAYLRAPAMRSPETDDGGES